MLGASLGPLGAWGISWGAQARITTSEQGKRPSGAEVPKASYWCLGVLGGPIGSLGAWDNSRVIRAIGAKMTTTDRKKRPSADEVPTGALVCLGPLEGLWGPGASPGVLGLSGLT